LTDPICLQLRPGTQTLIQALQAIPWTDEHVRGDGEDSSSSEDGRTDTEDEGDSKSCVVSRSELTFAPWA
jgi:hypothetical protein